MRRPITNESYDYSTSLLNSANLTLWLYCRRRIIIVILIFLFSIVLSPLWLFWIDPKEGVDWADTIEHVFTAAGILAGACALIGWLLARADRRTDLLVDLHARFSGEEIAKGKAIVEAAPAAITDAERDAIDRLLGFYVLLCGIRVSGEVPEKSLSICFRYWLTHYYREFVTIDPVSQKEIPKPNGLRLYLNANYPTVRTWLLEDVEKPERDKSFFRPHEFWGDKITTRRDDLWPEGKKK